MSSTLKIKPRNFYNIALFRDTIYLQTRSVILYLRAMNILQVSSFSIKEWEVHFETLLKALEYVISFTALVHKSPSNIPMYIDP